MRPTNERERFLASLDNPLVRAYAFACFGNLIACYHSQPHTFDSTRSRDHKISNSTDCLCRVDTTEPGGKSKNASGAHRRSPTLNLVGAYSPAPVYSASSTDMTDAGHVYTEKARQADVVNVVQCGTMSGDVPVSSVCLPAHAHRNERVGVRAAVVTNHNHKCELSEGVCDIDTHAKITCACDPSPQAYAPQHAYPCTSPTTHTPSAGTCSGTNFELSPSRRQRLIDLDKDPSVLHNHIYNHTQPSHRLGVMYERLLEFFLSTDPQYSLISSGLQVFDAGTGLGRRGGKCTIGEFDFVYHDHHSDEIVHLESAIKYFMSCKECDLETSTGGDCSGESEHERSTSECACPGSAGQRMSGNPLDGSVIDNSGSVGACAHSETWNSEKLMKGGVDLPRDSTRPPAGQTSLTGERPSEFVYRWLGPGRKDSLERKLNLMLKKQIQLSMCAEAEGVFMQLTAEYSAPDGCDDIPSAHDQEHETAKSNSGYNDKHVRSTYLLSDDPEAKPLEDSIDLINRNPRASAPGHGIEPSRCAPTSGENVLCKTERNTHATPHSRPGQRVVSTETSSRGVQVPNSTNDIIQNQRTKPQSGDLSPEDPSYLLSRFPSTETPRTSYKHNSHGASTELSWSSSCAYSCREAKLSQCTRTRHQTQPHIHTYDTQHQTIQKRSLRPSTFRVTVFGELYTHYRLTKPPTNLCTGLATTSVSTSHSTIPAPVGTHPSHHRGVWFHLSEFGAAVGFNASRFGIVVGKQRWLCPGRDTDEYNWGDNGRLSEGLYDETVRSHAALYELLVQHLHPTDFPAMVIEYGEGSGSHSGEAECEYLDTATELETPCSGNGRSIGSRVEIQRMFIVCDSWPRPWPPNKRSTEHIR
ncbi:hypothetical protein SARC_01308 [Sphaeroforma arctica JP610]|uniref:Uncharacterized protein n=1 Tax=Sphaeroforma arctica JP610 TaxID=667725 RepID=A0A0L0GC16_9EUKA|nr:hypothetical protein SARC_01308 [Sphaeroforma arctica JP610]KNC86535.1 hypothetical protein SARC_01308 [Sphaeroforma arctica JP610]|eukprot:XP_014160437.1 hypothetical protein SARC_01308 [Sphaeroforma arctica JP610]